VAMTGAEGALIETQRPPRRIDGSHRDGPGDQDPFPWGSGSPSAPGTRGMAAGDHPLHRASCSSREPRGVAQQGSHGRSTASAGTLNAFTEREAVCSTDAPG
jgi:hypothetical protein